MTRLALTLSVLALPAIAHAGDCDAIAKKANTAEGAELISAYKSYLA